jgi:hypothetical protein
MLVAAAAASPRHLLFIVCIDGHKSVIAFPHPQEGITVGSVWKGLQHKTAFVTVAINKNPPSEEQLFEEGDDDIALCSSNDEDSDF